MIKERFKVGQLPGDIPPEEKTKFKSVKKVRLARERAMAKERFQARIKNEIY